MQHTGLLCDLHHKLNLDPSLQCQVTACPHPALASATSLICCDVLGAPLFGEFYREGCVVCAVRAESSSASVSPCSPHRRWCPLPDIRHTHTPYVPHREGCLYTMARPCKVRPIHSVCVSYREGYHIATPQWEHVRSKYGDATTIAL